jgi:hypothetical protein
MHQPTLSSSRRLLLDILSGRKIDKYQLTMGVGDEDCTIVFFDIEPGS